MTSSLRRSHEAGSIPLTILATIVLGGIIVVLFASVNTGVKTSRNDRDFAQSVQIADAGIQDAYVNLLRAAAVLEANEDETLDENLLVGPMCPNPDLGSDIDFGVCRGDVGEESTYTWTYAREGGYGSRSWVVDSRGTYRDNTRQVRSSIGQQPIFKDALQARCGLDYNGAANVSDTFTIGTGCAMKFTSPASTGSVEKLTVYGTDGDDAASKYQGFPAEDIVYAGEDLVLEDLSAQAFDTGPCRPDGGIATIGNIPRNPQRGQTYCVTDFIVTNPGDNLVLQGAPNPGPDGQVIVYVRGNVNIQSKDVHANGDADELQIYASGPVVKIGGNPTVAATIWAPNAACDSNGGSGGFAGALACKSIDINGNWKFDASSQSILSSTFKVGKWTEQRPTPTPSATG
jgi:hypothetical protein